MRKRPSARRNLIIVFTGAILLACLIVITPMLSRSSRIMPPESEEVQAKRLAPENAYYALVEAESLRPQQPEALLVFDEASPKFKVRYLPEKGSLGESLGIYRPDDDPEFLSFLDQCGPWIEKVREALGKPYYLIPVTWSEVKTDEALQEAGLRRHSGWQHTFCNLLVASAVHVARKGGDGPEAFRLLLDSCRLTRLLTSDGPPGYLGGGLPYYAFEVAHSASPEVLRASPQRGAPTPPRVARRPTQR